MIARGSQPPTFTDLENARQFAKNYKGTLRYVPIGRYWLVWDGRRWTRDETCEVQRCAKEMAQSLYAKASKVKDSSARKKRRGYALAAQRASRIGAMIEAPRVSRASR